MPKPPVRSWGSSESALTKPVRVTWRYCRRISTSAEYSVTLNAEKKKEERTEERTARGKQAG